MAVTSAGREVPAGEHSEILAPGDLLCGRERIFRGRAEDGEIGWIFLDADALAPVDAVVRAVMRFWYITLVALLGCKEGGPTARERAVVQLSAIA